jgi:hypothetical protein
VPTEDRANRREGRSPHFGEQAGRGDERQTGASEAVEPVDDAGEQQDDQDRLLGVLMAEGFSAEEAFPRGAYSAEVGGALQGVEVSPGVSLL